MLHKLKIHKASGPDQVPARLLKTVADEIAPALSLLFKAALYQGKSPSDWNHALVTPIFKKGDRTQVVNYRPIFLTSIVSKCFEHIVHHHIMLHVDELAILHDAQHGLCRKRSCESQLLVLAIHDLAKSLDSGSQIDAVLLDFSKAFEKVPH